MLIRDHVYKLTFVGLKPQTRHYFYIDKEQVASSLLKPYGGVCGDALVSNLDGSIVLIGYYVTQAFTATSKEQLRIIDKSRQMRQRVGVICNINAAILTDELYNQATSRSLVYL